MRGRQETTYSRLYTLDFQSKSSNLKFEVGNLLQLYLRFALNGELCTLLQVFQLLIPDSDIDPKHKLPS